MQRRLRTSFLLIALILTAALPQTAAGGTDSPLRAELDGHSLPPSAVGEYYCHDLDWPTIQCYSSSPELEDAVTGLVLRRAMSLASIKGGTDVNYVRLYDLSGYAGPYIYLSADYSDLSVIGWNDRASSYVAVNSLASALYVNTYYAGATLFLCCNQHAPSLSSTFDNHISSARRT